MEERYVKEFKAFLKDTKRHGEITQYRYVVAMKDFDINQISQDYINQYVQERKNTSMVRGAMLSFLEMNGIKKLFDMPPKATGRERVREKREISKEEFNAVSKHLYSKSFRDGLLLDVIHEGALRICEVKSIRLNSFRWEQFFKGQDKSCKLSVIGKGNKERIVLISPNTMDKILDFYSKKLNFEDVETIKKFQNSPTNVFRKDKKTLTEFQIWKIIHKASKEAIGRDIRPHELRSARATELIEMGIPMHHVKNYLGHKSVATTEIYLHQDATKSIKEIGHILEKNQ